MAKKFVIAIVAAAAMVGCIKRTDVEPTAPTPGSATVSGFVRVSTEIAGDTITNVIDEDRVWEYDQLSNVQIKFTYDAGDLDPDYTGTSTTKYVSVSPSTTDGSWSASIETPSVGAIDVDWEINDAIYFDQSDSVGTAYVTERIMYSLESGPNGTTTSGTLNDLSSGETRKLDDFIFAD